MGKQIIDIKALECYHDNVVSVKVSALEAEDKLAVKSINDNKPDKQGNINLTNDTIYSDKWYGIEWSPEAGIKKIKRIGNLDLHRSLPIQNKLKRCVLRDDGSVNYYLDPTDSTRPTDHIHSAGNADLTGEDGSVMVEFPEFYWRFETHAKGTGYSKITTNRVMISEHAIPGFEKVDKLYVSAFEATLDRRIPQRPKLVSVINNSPEFRGGNNDESLDDKANTLLGKPVSNHSLTEFREFARNKGKGFAYSAGWNCTVYNYIKIRNWLYFIEYCNFDVTAPFNPEVDDDGFKQGGLGEGVRPEAIGHSDGWANYNNENPIIPCGVTTELGNATGTISHEITLSDGASKVFQVPSYRGIENPFGHILEWTDGILLKHPGENGGLAEFYVAVNPFMFNDSDFSGYRYVQDIQTNASFIYKMAFAQPEHIENAYDGGVVPAFAPDNTYSAANLYGAPGNSNTPKQSYKATGDILPSQVGHYSPSVYFYGYANILSTHESSPSSPSVYGVMYGDTSRDDVIGFFTFNATNAPSGKSTKCGTRLCYIPGSSANYTTSKLLLDIATKADINEKFGLLSL